MMSQIYLKNKQKKSVEQKKGRTRRIFCKYIVFFLDVYECFCKW